MKKTAATTATPTRRAANAALLKSIKPKTLAELVTLWEDTTKVAHCVGLPMDADTSFDAFLRLLMETHQERYSKAVRGHLQMLETFGPLMQRLTPVSPTTAARR